MRDEVDVLQRVALDTQRQAIPVQIPVDDRRISEHDLLQQIHHRHAIHTPKLLRGKACISIVRVNIVQFAVGFDPRVAGLHLPVHLLRLRLGRGNRHQLVVDEEFPDGGRSDEDQHQGKGKQPPAGLLDAHQRHIDVGLGGRASPDGRRTLFFA